ncbi:MAG: hypothetical protein M1839_003242 [Geoglossum umbratile]|nr:MAG: hypothetical protein M1839_003242 [Geoglossum umbratile]
MSPSHTSTVAIKNRKTKQLSTLLLAQRYDWALPLVIDASPGNASIAQEATKIRNLSPETHGGLNSYSRVAYLRRQFQCRVHGNAAVAARHIATLIASLLQQLVQRTPVISDGIVSLYHHHIEKRTRPTLVEWSKSLQSEVYRFSKVFIIIDALDECLESNGTRDSFLAEIKKLQPSVRLLVTSRYIPTIEYEFEKAARVEIRASDEDVRRYLEGRIERERRSVRHVRADLALQKTIIDTIVEKAKGMFLLAQLYMDSLVKKQNRRDIRIALKNLPKELDDTYDEAMRRIENQDKEDVKLAKQVLCWISYSFGPLAVIEIQHALAVEPNQTEFDEEALPVEDVMVSVCAGLITTDPESSIIRLVHYTTQEYFERNRLKWIPGSHAKIAMTCLVYMSFDDFTKGHCLSDQELEIRLEKYPLLEYTAQHWGDHVRESPEDTINELALNFLEHHSKSVCPCQVMHLPEHRYSGYSQSFPKDVAGLQIAAYFGLVRIVRLLFEKGADVAAKDGRGQTALHWAAAKGHEVVARLLLQKDADIEEKDMSGQTALHEAAEKGHKAVVQLLLDHKADVNGKTREGRTALHEAAGNGHEAVARLLLDHKADVDAKTRVGRTALHEAAENGHGAVARLLLTPLSRDS